MGRDCKRGKIDLGLGWIATLVIASCASGCGSDTPDARVDSSSSPVLDAGMEAGSRTNHAPVVDELAIRPARPAPGREVQVSARASDPDGDPTKIEFHWQTSQGRLIGEGRTLDTRGLEPGSRLEVIAIASDGKLAGEPRTQAFQLSEPSPMILLVAIDTAEGTTPGSTLRAVVEIEDDASDRVETALEWKVNGQTVGSDETLDTQDFLPGDRVILLARLELEHESSRPVASQPLVLSRSGAPKITSEPLAGIEGGIFRYQIRARSDQPSAELKYALLTGPPGMSVDATSGLVQWRPADDQRGSFDVEVSATDKWGSGVAQSFSIVADSPTAPPARPR